MPAAWFEVTVDVPREYGDAVGNFLVECGAPGLQLEERDGTQTLVTYFSEPPPIEPLRRFCAALGCPLDGADIRTRTVGAENWAENWKLHFRPLPVGKRLYVCPPWDSTTPPDRLAVVIDPGMAFGTGHHASTRGCLELLDWATRIAPVRRALDIGTGSGILAIAMAKLGVSEVWGVDTDPQALAIAATNAIRNDVAGHVHLAACVDAVAGRFELVTANLFANILEQLATQVVGLITPGGILICAGLLAEDEHRCRSAYSREGLTLRQRVEEEGWVAMALGRGRAR